MHKETTIFIRIAHRILSVRCSLKLNLHDYTKLHHHHQSDRLSYSASMLYETDMEDHMERCPVPLQNSRTRTTLSISISQSTLQCPAPCSHHPFHNPTCCPPSLQFYNTLRRPAPCSHHWFHNPTRRPPSLQFYNTLRRPAPCSHHRFHNPTRRSPSLQFYNTLRHPALRSPCPFHNALCHPHPLSAYFPIGHQVSIKAQQLL